MPPTEVTDGSGEADSLEIRPGTTQDLPDVHEVFVASRPGPGHPAQERSPAEVRAWVDGLLDRPGELWVATVGGGPVGFMLLRGSWLDLLFVHPGRPAQGVGSALLELAKGLRPHGFGLRVFQANDRARDFYRRHDLVELECTDGSGYDDAEPDLRMAWLGEDPMAYLRHQIDQVDDEVAVLLARRVALTAAVQDQKEVGGRAGRDPDREDEIVERMARHVPELGRERIARVMHTVIEESLAAWEEGPD